MAAPEKGEVVVAEEHISSSVDQEDPHHAASTAPMAEHPALRVEYPAPTVGHPAPTATHPAPTATHPAPTVGHPAPTATHPAPTARHPAPTVGHPAPTATHPAPTARHPAPIIMAFSQDTRRLSPVNQFKLKKFFVLRPGTLNQAIEDVKAVVDQEVDGSIHGIWLMAEVDHWNNEKERIVLITDSSLLICKYDFVMFDCEQIQRIPLNIVDRITHGTFSFPKFSLLRREGVGVRVFWDRLREPSFVSRWNPFATDFPYITFTYHPARNISDSFSAICDVKNFWEVLKNTSQKAHTVKPVPGKANGVMVLNQPILIQAYVGLMSAIGNQNRLGYSMARGNIGF